MSLSRLLTGLACSVFLFNLTSCGIGRVDVTNPTVAEMDALDTQWGLEPRKSRGGPRRNFQYVEPAVNSVVPASAQQPTVAPLPPRETVRGAPPVSLNPEPPVSAPVVAPSNLR